MRTYQKCVRKPFTTRTYKIIGLKLPWNEHLQKRWPPPPCLLAPSYGILALRLCGGRENSDGTTKHCERNAVGADRGLFTGCARGFDGARLGHHGHRRQRKNCWRR